MSIAAALPLPAPAPDPGSARRFVIVDDHPIVREGVAARIGRAVPTSLVVYSGPCIRDAVRAGLRLGCDCAIVDVNLGRGMSAVEIVSAFAIHGLPVLVLDEHASAQACASMMAAGAQGYVGKDADPAQICDAVSSVMAGRPWQPRGMALASRMRPGIELSAQERRTLILYGSGLTQDMVARRMGIASSTVKHYLDKVREKCAAAGVPARTKIELHALARSEGLLP